MIVVVAYLASARTGETTELGRMYIANDGTGTREVSSYNVAIARKGDAEVPRPFNPSGNAPTRTGKVEMWPRLRKTIWQLIGRAIANAYGGSA